MGVADVGDHGNVRPHHGSQIFDLAEVVHAGLDHRRLMLRGKAQQRQGRTDVVVEILRRLEDVQLGPQHRRDHLLGGRLAHAAGDLNEGDLKPIPVGGGQIPQSQPGIRCLDVKFILPDILGQLGAQTARRAGVQRRVDELVAVELLPHPRQKQAAGNDPPAVRGNGAHHRDLLAGIPPDTLDRGRDLCYRHWLHTLSPLDLQGLPHDLLAQVIIADAHGGGLLGHEAGGGHSRQGVGLQTPELPVFV